MVLYRQETVGAGRNIGLHRLVESVGGLYRIELGLVCNNHPYDPSRYAPRRSAIKVER